MHCPTTGRGLGLHRDPGLAELGQWQAIWPDGAHTTGGARGAERSGISPVARRGGALLAGWPMCSARSLAQIDLRALQLQSMAPASWLWPASKPGLVIRLWRSLDGLPKNLSVTFAREDLI